MPRLALSRRTSPVKLQSFLPHENNDAAAAKCVRLVSEREWVTHWRLRVIGVGAEVTNGAWNAYWRRK
jgi:hypothetical protein